MMLYSSMSSAAWASISAGRVRPWRQKGAMPMRLQHHVDGHAERPDDALAEPVVGDVAQAEALPRADAQLAYRLAGELDVAAATAALAGDGLGERPLAVAVHAGDADHLAGVHRQA